ncbi:short-chain collagen C4-like isoform X2 [Montipora foliosa]|uniref:short-chain collagen C4-like isoform X2 n=1 Tax=Montipora foliosa TaxID=591990 RepID=UPI0035F1824A
MASSFKQGTSTVSKHATKMEQESIKSRNSPPSSALRLVHFVTVVCMFAFLVFLFVSFRLQNKRIDDLENELLELKSNQAQSEDLDAKKPLSLPDLNKKVTSLDSRITDLSNEIAKKTTLRGRDGRDGVPGPPGPAGRDGRDGRQGPQGLRGIIGTKGEAGHKEIPGLQGPPGARGPRGPQGPRLAGVSYNRWGRTSCSGNATVVYTGFMGSGFYTQIGGGSNYLCLPDNPVFDEISPGWQGTAAIYGTEYETGSFPRLSHLQDHQAPCAVCYVSARASQVMIPATNNCPSGWTKEYTGYLMTSHYAHAHESEFVCIDKDAETVPGSHTDTNGALLYVVQSTCGTLPCKPYTQGHELTCVVCSK